MLLGCLGLSGDHPFLEKEKSNSYQREGADYSRRKRTRLTPSDSTVDDSGQMFEELNGRGTLNLEFYT